MTILELLKRSNPMAWVQGHHTRIVVYEDNADGRFEVLSKSNKMRYTTSEYHGDSENMAVETFIVVENR